MEVTRLNFQKILPEIEDTINKCTFISIDGEFTGLSTGLEKAFSAFDTPAEYYAKLRSGSIDFLFIQFGLVAFIYNEESKKYTHRAYNFYLFPRPLNRQAPDCRFVCQSSSIDFLASNGFDFNKLFNEGIPYLNKPDELAMRVKFADMRERRKSLGEQNNSFVECPPEHQDAVGKSIESIVNFLSGPSDKEELSLPQCSGFVRKLIYQEVWKRYTADDLSIETKNGVMVVRRPISIEEKEKNEKKKLEEEKAEIEGAIGFSKVIRLISQSGKLVVGHNMLLDLCHIVHRFCSPLPESYADFKELLHTVFPNVLDTKLMSSSQPLADLIPSTVLPHILATIKKEPFTLLQTEPEEGEPSYSTADEKHHEAGFDAFLTGIIAIALSDYVRDHHSKIKKVKPSHKLPSSNSPHLKKYINRLFMMKVMDCFIDLEADDPDPDREGVFHVTFPEDWKLSDLTNLFSPFGGAYVSWIDSRSAYCRLNDASNAAQATRQLVTSTAVAGVSVVAYKAHRNRTAVRNSPPMPPHSRRSQERSMKRPSVEPIPEESEESDKEGVAGESKQPRKKRKMDKEETKSKLFEENVNW